MLRCHPPLPTLTFAMSEEKWWKRKYDEHDDSSEEKGKEHNDSCTRIMCRCIQEKKGEAGVYSATLQH